MKRSKMGLAALTLVAGTIFGCGLADAYDDLSLKIRTGADRLEITNIGSDSASGCTVIVNSRFRREDLRLPRNEAVTINLGSLIGGGVRFAPGVDGVDRVHVLCSEPRSADILFKP